jgi:hypothetical protein
MRYDRGAKAGLWILIGAVLLSPVPLSAAQTLQILLPESGSIYWEASFPEQATFILRHCNSIYDAWLEERFQGDRHGRIQLTAVKTAHPAVLEYHGLEASSADWVPLVRSLDKIPLLVSKRGRLTLLFEHHSIPLSQNLPDGTRVEIRIIPTSE